MHTHARVAKRPLILAMLLLVGAGLTGCGGGDPHEAVAEDMLETMKEFNGVMKGITDEASAKAAKSDLEAVAKKFTAVKAEMDKIGKPSKEKEAELEKKFKGEIETVMGEFMGHMMRIGSNEKLKPHLESVMKEVGGAMRN